jgi:hypothetical protein
MLYWYVLISFYQLLYLIAILHHGVHSYTFKCDYSVEIYAGNGTLIPKCNLFEVYQSQNVQHGFCPLNAIPVAFDAYFIY